MLIPLSNEIPIEYLCPFTSKEYISLLCFYCKNECFKQKSKILSALKHGRMIFCSNRCYGNYQKSSRISTQCANCSVEMLVIKSSFRKCKNNKRFCSQSCAATYNNKVYPKRVLNKNCLLCDTLISQKRKFCSRQCVQKYNWEQHKLIIEAYGGFEKENRSMARKYLIDTQGYQCQICGISKWTGQPVPLVCDHIDGDYKNNRLNNLRMICQNCNALLPTFGSKNKGRGREDKKLAYHKNKNNPNFRV